MKVFTKQRLALLVFFITSSVFLAQTSAQVVFTDDFESGISNWEVTGAWGITNEYAYSPDNSLTDSPGGIYLPNQEIYATMANGVDLSDPTILSADVSWWMIMDIENGNFDYLYVEVSDDDFSTFTQIASFFGEGMLDPWIEYTYPLGSLLGSDNVKVRFHFSSDAGYEVDGCYIDDFSIVTSDIDEAPPEIFFDAPFAYEGSLGDYVVDAEILDASGVASAEVEYTVDGAVQPNVIGANTGGDSWEFTIPQQDPGYQVDFVIIAIDASPNANEAVTDTASYIAGEYIGYDNAVVDFYTSIAAPGGTAVVFTIEDPSQLVTALIRNYTDQSQPPNDEMVVHIWGDGGSGPGADLITPIAIMPEANLVHTRAFTRIDLRPYAAQLSSLQGDIFVGFTVPSGIVLTTISQPGIANRSFSSTDGSTWNSIGDDYHYRIIVGPGITNPNPPPTNLEYTVDYNDVTLTWDAPGGGGELIELVQHDGNFENAYYQAYDNGYGVVYDISAYPGATLEFIDFRHSSWGVFGTWDYKLHVVDWDTYTEVFVTDVLQSTGDDTWEESITLGSLAGESGLVGIFLEPMSNDPADAYPCIDSDNVGPDGMSYYGPLSDYSAMGLSTIGDFLMDLWIMTSEDKIVVKPPKVQINNNTTGIAHKAITPLTGTEFTLQQKESFVSIKEALLGYNVYRDDEVLDYVTAPTTEYVDVDVPIGVHTYYVTAVHDEGESDPSNTVTVDIITSVPDVDASQMVIYPNPATNMVNIESESEIISLVLYTYLGQVVTNLEPGINKVVLDVSNREPGIYFVRLETEKGVVTKKIAIE